jgi:HEAT repeats
VALTAILSLALLLSQAQETKLQIGEIEFFGSAGFNLDRIRAQLPVHEGDTLTVSSSDKARAQINKTLQDVTGHIPTDIVFTCCDEKQRLMIFLGLGGRSSEDIRYNAAPTGSVRLPVELLALSKQFDAALEEAVKKGQSGEEDSKGYALLEYPKARDLQMKLRDYSLKNETVLRQVLANSSDADQRAIAAEALGYAAQSPDQISALVQASRDPNSEVRNNAVRALEVLATTGADIPSAGFVEMLGSGIWTDRNKASILLMKITRRRDPKLIAELRSDAIDPLIEMAQWRNNGHAYPARILLGRVAGIEEAKLQELAEKGQVDVIIKAIRRRP